MNVKSRKAEQSEATRGALVGVARELFTDPGYAETTTNELVQRAGVTRGALYHHFKEKRDVFEAVFEAIHTELAEQLVAVASKERGALDQLRAGCIRYLDLALEPSVQRIILVDGPSVLGSQRWREMTASGVEMIRVGLTEAIDEGLIEQQPVDTLAHALTGAIHEAALAIALSQSKRKTRAEAGETIDRLISGLRLKRTAKKR